jgi:conjugal transfer/entry exclusion protein
MSSKADLAVDLAGLQKIADDLNTVKNQMNDFGSTDKDSLSDSEIADSKVKGALDDFAGGWRDGRKEIAGGIDSVAKMAAKVVEELTKKDEELRNELIKAGGHAPGGGH